MLHAVSRIHMSCVRASCLQLTKKNVRHYNALSNSAAVQECIKKIAPCNRPMSGALCRHFTNKCSDVKEIRRVCGCNFSPAFGNKCHRIRRYPSHAPYSSSALYIPHGDDSNVAVVEVDLDLEETFRNVEELAHNLQARNRSGVDTSFLLSQYKELVQLQNTQQKLEAEKEGIAGQMKILVKQKEKSRSKEKEELINRGKEVRNELKHIYSTLWPLEESVILAALKLPAFLEDDTPKQDVVLEKFGQKPDFQCKVRDHVELGQSTQTLFFSPVSPGAYYLQDKLALLELNLMAHVTATLHRQGLRQFSCPDFAKTLVMEGYGEKFEDPQQVYTLQSKDTTSGSDVEDMAKVDTTLHFVGGAAYASWAGFLTKMNISSKSLPLQVFSVGRHYHPGKHKGNKPMSLLNAPQSNQVSIFAATRTTREGRHIFEEYQNILKEIYTDLGLATRLVRVCAQRLRDCETSRVELQVWMPSHHAYIPVAEVGMCGDYISRRLMIKHSDDVDDLQNRDYLHMIHGTVFSTGPLLAAIMENFQSEKDGDANFEIPQNLRDLCKSDT